MQVYFDMNYTSRREFIEEHQRVLQSRLVPVSREITGQAEPGFPNRHHHSERGYSCLTERLSPVRAGTFMSLIKKEKEQQLNDLSMIVTGIRLFNKERQQERRRGHRRLASNSDEAIPSTSKDIEWELELSQRLAWQYTAWLERLLDPEVETRECIVPLDMLKQALYNVRQHEAFLKVILADVILCAKQVETLQTELATRMKLLRVTIHSKTAVPTAQVFPHFTALAKFWSGLQDEMVLLSILGNMMENLQPFLAAQSQLFPDAALRQTLICWRPTFVKSYEWNEWELRRKAIKLANLRGKVTHSMQTNLSHMRRDNVTQTYLPKDVACQSKRDGKSNVPKPQVYLAGLRGGKNQHYTHMIKTNLTRSVDD
ncbi:hypothetical protein J4Q44_G00343120 [Coregonus suidteri]|uniref:Cilia- and flagella-associated protein 206 n=1 Tax=Coregonus suidteri TaxID=861788 RepID=A0AAN8QCV5_9TELE